MQIKTAAIILPNGPISSITLTDLFDFLKKIIRFKMKIIKASIIKNKNSDPENIKKLFFANGNEYIKLNRLVLTNNFIKK